MGLVDDRGSPRPWVWLPTIFAAAANLLYRQRRLAAGASAAAAHASRLETMNAELQSVNDELKAFSYSVSHDLRAPLRAIDGFSRILLEDDDNTLSSGQQRYLGLISDSAKTMGVLIDDLLTLSRLANQPLQREIVQTAELVADVQRTLAGERDERVLIFDNGTLPAVQADRRLLHQVFMNLLDNAVKYTRAVPEARITVDSESQEGVVTFRVADNGPGFDMRYADKLFKVFQRLHLAEEYEGSGVGLAVVSRIISRHGGEVWAEGKVGEGATFYFTLEGRTDEPADN